jgi:hypothetical protein
MSVGLCVDCVEKFFRVYLGTHHQLIIVILVLSIVDLTPSPETNLLHRKEVIRTRTPSLTL